MGDQEEERKFVLKARLKGKGCTCKTTDVGFALLQFALWDDRAPHQLFVGKVHFGN